MLNEYGHDATLHVLTKLLISVDTMLGNENSDYDRLQTIAANALHTNLHRSFGFLVLSIRDGMNRTDKEGKGFNKVTVQLIAEWTAAQEGKIIGMVEDEHARSTVRGDNWDGKYMEKLEHESTKDKDRVKHLSQQVRDLKNKLNVEKP